MPVRLTDCIWVGVAITRSVSKSSLSAVPMLRWESCFFPVNSALKPMSLTAHRRSMGSVLRVAYRRCPNVFIVIFVQRLEIFRALKNPDRCTLILGRQCILTFPLSASAPLQIKRRLWAPSVLCWMMAGLTIADPIVPGWVTGLWTRGFSPRA